MIYIHISSTSAGLQDRDVLADVGVHVGGPGKLRHLKLARRGTSHKGARDLIKKVINFVTLVFSP